MRPILATVLAAFSAFSLWVMSEVGYFGIWQAGLAGPGAWQLLADLSVALLLVLSWMRRDAAANGRSFWPWVPLTLALGSIGPLLYLLAAPLRTARARAEAA